MPVDPVSGDFRIEGLGAEASVGARPGATTEVSGQGFGQMLAGAIDKLEGSLAEANQQSAALAAGKADDLTSVVLAVQRASLNVQLAVQVRNKAVEAYQDLFRIQI
jgi:flagellar hook-basal body complex protein FliE